MGRTSDARARLLDSAIELISERSYGEVGVQALCDHADVRKGSFYHFFQSKEELAVAAVDHHWACVREQVMEPVFRCELPPLLRIQRFIESYADAQLSAKARCGRMPGCHFGNLAAELSTQSSAVRDKLREVFEAQVSILAETVAQAVEAGEIEPVDPPQAAEAILAYVQGLMVMAKLHDDPALLQRMSGSAVQLLGLPGAAPAFATDAGQASRT